jgi:hypothetical protein
MLPPPPSFSRITWIDTRGSSGVRLDPIGKESGLPGS